MGIESIRSWSVRRDYLFEKELNPFERGTRESSRWRDDLREKYRAKTPEPVRSYLNRDRPLEAEQLKTRDYWKANKSNPTADLWAVRLGKVGVGLTGVSLGLSVYQVVESDNPGREAAGQAFSWGAAYSLGLAGAEGGAMFGPWGSLAGGLVGSTVGGFIGEEGGKAFYDVMSSDLPLATKVQILGLPFTR